jgi:hypothetical protein
MTTQIRFASKTAEQIQTGDLMRQADEEKKQTNYYHYRAEKVFVGEIVDAIHDADGTFIGNRREDGVEILWTPIEGGKSFTRRYARLAVVEVAVSPVTDVTQLITQEETEEEI